MNYFKEDEENPVGMGTKIMSVSFSIALATAAVTGLGYLNEIGMQKQDNALRGRMTENQTSFISSAAESEQCNLLRPNYARLCYQERSQADGLSGSDAIADVDANMALDNPGFEF